AAMVLVLALMTLAAGDGRAQSGQTQLEDVERAIEQEQAEADALADEAARQAAAIEDLRAQMIVAARAIQQHETRVASLSAEIEVLDQARQETAAGLLSRRGELAATLAALQRVALVPPAALLAQPLTVAGKTPGGGDGGIHRDAGARQMVRGAIVLAALLRQVDARADALRRDLDRMATLRQDLAASRASLAVAGAALQTERNTLQGLVSERRAALNQTEAERRDTSRRLAELAEQATSLRQLLDAATALTPPAIVTRPDTAAAGLTSAPVFPPIAGARGRLFVPVTGTIHTRFGDSDINGGVSRGLTLAASPAATVVSPYSGTIVFAGPFRSYGQLLIIEHGDGYHSLLAGLSRIDGAVGQWVAAGEPVGAMAPLSVGGPSLYVELRHNGEPVDPLPWLAATVTPQEGQG
ncbi:MAG: peptidoglycan DD-metalloendopeptidase family protein, partial [Alphaproteobacteria bacterium]